MYADVESSSARYLDTAILGFLFAFITTPFSAIGLVFVFTMIALECFYHVYCSEELCFPTRMFIILLTVFGRLLGEIFWPFVIFQGSKYT